MIKLLKMDLTRMFKGKTFYILLAVLVMMSFSLFLAGGSATSIASMIGPISLSGGTEDFGASMLGLSLVIAFSAIMVCTYIGSDFASGFAKNIFTVHPKKMQYITSKYIISMIAFVSMSAVYLLITIIVGCIMGMEMGLPSVGGLFLFVLEKLLAAFAINALTICVSVAIRHRVWSLLATVMISMGGLTMGIQVLGDTMNLPILSKLATFSPAGVSGLATLTLNGMAFLQILLVAVGWTCVGLYLGKVALNKIDIR